MGDGAGNCAGQPRYERAVKEGVCGRSHCAYYANPKPRSRWAGASTGRSKDSIATVSVMPSILAGPGEATIGRQRYRPALVGSGHGRHDASSSRYYGY